MDNFIDLFDLLVNIGTLIVAWLALSTWKKQLKGTDEYQLLKKLLIATYEVEEKIKFVRNPMVTMKKEDIETSSKLDVEMNIYNERYNALVKEYLILKPLVLEANFYWDKNNIKALFTPLEGIIGELRGAIWMHFWVKGAYDPFDKPVIDKIEKIANDKIIYDTSSKTKPDEFTKKVSLIIAEIETFINENMKKKFR